MSEEQRYLIPKSALDLIDYYNSSTIRDWAGRATTFQAIAGIADGLAPMLFNSAPQVALFSSRGPDVKDFSFQDADVLKPNILTPGSLIWAAWAPNGTDEARAHQYSASEIMTLTRATPFDYGSGAVNPKAALDPGLVLDATPRGSEHPYDLNIPSITMSQLKGMQTVKRTVTSVAATAETYTIMTRMPPDIALEVAPPALTVLPRASREITATLTARSVTGTYSFGEITMKGDRGHLVRIPVVAMGFK
ncbi:hypothetical protein ABZP36_010118 [Zizania latifolia]